MSLDIGVLIVGSLYWDESNNRKKWRSEFLNLDSEINVRAPIRYGRKSECRNDTYTIVFSRLCLWESHGLGTAKAVPCSSLAHEPEDMIKEAKSLWAVEYKKSPCDRSYGISRNWGCIGLLPNPNRDIPDTFLDKWSKTVKNEEYYGNISHSKSEGEIVDDDGLFRIPWPSTINNDPLDLDLLLATATDPTLDGDPPTYPRIREVANAWNEDQNDRVNYFWNNLENGITTYQDEKIKEYLK